MTNDPGAPQRRSPPGGASPSRFVWPIVLGLGLGTAVFGGFQIWTHMKAEHAAEVAPGDPDLAKPPAAECAIVQTIMTQVHASGTDARWRSDNAVRNMTLVGRSQVLNPYVTPGYTDDEAADLRAKSPIDWRGCPGMGAFVRSLGWSPVDEDEVTPALVLARPAFDKAGDEAKVYEAFLVPNADSGLLQIKAGPDLLTLSAQPGGAWKITATAALPRRH